MNTTNIQSTMTKIHQPSPLPTSPTNSDESPRQYPPINPSFSEDSHDLDVIPMQAVWRPSGSWWRDCWYFVGPGWWVSIAYIDPGNYQADIQAGATSRYSLLSILWWTSLLSIYVQVLCVRLAYYSNLTLAQAQARYSPNLRYLNWFLVEISTILTDLPEVIGIGIACKVFLGWPYYIGVILSLITTMIFLATLQYGVRVLEAIIVFFVGLMSVSLFVEMDIVHADTKALFEGWAYGFVNLENSDMFAITGVVGSVVMPHNLHLHTAVCQSRPAAKDFVPLAVKWSCWEPVLPILMSFFVNMAIVSIAAERVYGTDGADSVGLTDFCTYFEKLSGGCILWGIALLAAGQSSAITTTYTGQYVMDGFLNIQLPVRQRAVLTRLVAIVPCLIVSMAFPHQLNHLVNLVNSSLSLLLPFSFAPLVKYNCSVAVLKDKAAQGLERILLYTFAVAVYLVNAASLSLKGGGFFGDMRAQMDNGWRKALVVVAESCIQLFYAWWNWQCLRKSITVEPIPMIDEDEPDLYDGVEDEEEDAACMTSPQAKDSILRHRELDHGEHEENGLNELI